MTDKLAILQPVFALAAWTGCMLLLLAFRRLRSGVTDKVSPREFALGESARVPQAALLANRNYMNLLELPVLFYVVCLVALATAAVSPMLVTLAWLYVVLRVVHSLIHVTYNQVMHRFAAFALSNGVLVATWVVLGLRLTTEGGAR